jgi:hypothetical protein
MMAQQTVTGYVLFEEFASNESFSSDPLDSRKLSICFVSKLCGNKKVHPLMDVKTNYVLLLYQQGFVVLPLMHFN